MRRSHAFSVLMKGLAGLDCGEVCFADVCLGGRTRYARRWGSYREDVRLHFGNDAQSMRLALGFEAVLPEGTEDMGRGPSGNEHGLHRLDLRENAVALLFLDHLAGTGAHDGRTYRERVADVLYQHLVLQYEGRLLKHGPRACTGAQARVYQGVASALKKPKWRPIDDNHGLGQDVTDKVEDMIDGGEAASPLPLAAPLDGSLPVPAANQWDASSPVVERFVSMSHLGALRDDLDEKIGWLWSYPEANIGDPNPRRHLVGAAAADRDQWHMAAGLLDDWVWGDGARRDGRGLARIDALISDVAVEMLGLDREGAQRLMSLHANLRKRVGGVAEEAGRVGRDYLQPLLAAVLAAVAHGPGCLRGLGLDANVWEGPVPTAGPEGPILVDRADATRPCLIVSAGTQGPSGPDAVLCEVVDLLPGGTYCFGRAPHDRGGAPAAIEGRFDEDSAEPECHAFDLADPAISRLALTVACRAGAVCATSVGMNGAWLVPWGGGHAEAMAPGVATGLGAGDTVELVGNARNVYLTLANRLAAAVADDGRPARAGGDAECPSPAGRPASGSSPAGSAAQGRAVAGHGAPMRGCADPSSPSLPEFGRDLRMSDMRRIARELREALDAGMDAFDAEVVDAWYLRLDESVARHMREAGPNLNRAAKKGWQDALGEVAELVERARRRF